MLHDVLITTEGLRDSIIQAECRRIGARTSLKVLGACATPKLLPVYRCSEYNLCSPFGRVLVEEPEIVHACLGCEDFTRKEPDK